MRKSIFDIVKDNTNLANDVLRLDSMFLKEEILRVNRGIPYTLKDYVEDYCFETWKYRNHCLDVDDFLRTVNYNNLKRSATINAEDIYLEFQLGSRRSRSKFLTFYRYITNPNQGHPGRNGQVQVVVWRFFYCQIQRRTLKTA